MNEFSRRGFLGLAGGAPASPVSPPVPAPARHPSTGGGGGSSNTIEFWSNHPGNSKPVEQEIIKAFEAANPGLKVKLVDAGKNYEEVAQKFNASLAGGHAARRRRRLRRHVVQLRAQQAVQPARRAALDGRR